MILVTGATGFIGTHLVRTLVSGGAKVRCLARHLSNIAELKSMGVEIALGDVTNLSSLKYAMHGVDVVFHLAAYVKTGKIQDAEVMQEINVIGTQNALEAAKAENVRKFIYLGSMGAMGIHDTKELVTESCMGKPNNAYGLSKLQAENLVLVADTSKELCTVVLRPPTVYGQGESHNFILTARAIKNHRFMLIGNGNNLLSLCYIDNLIEALICAGKYGQRGRVYLIADSQPITWNKFIMLLSNQVGVPNIHIPKLMASLVAIIPNPYLYPNRVNTMTANFGFDITKARTELRYIPLVSTAEGIKRTVDWYKTTGLL